MTPVFGTLARRMSARMIFLADPITAHCRIQKPNGRSARGRLGTLTITKGTAVRFWFAVNGRKLGRGHGSDVCDAVTWSRGVCAVVDRGSRS